MTDQQILAGPGEIAEDSKSLGLNMYAYLDDGTLQTVFSSPDMGQGPGAVAWLTGNFSGPAGAMQIAQLWDNGNLGLNVYGIHGFGFQTMFSAPDLGQGPGALAFLTGDFTGSGNDEIAQLWDNNGNLGVIGYGIVGETPQTVFESPDLGQGPGALAFLAGDFTGSGHTEIGQVWEDNGNLGLIVYGYVNGTPQTVFSASDLFEGSGALAFLTGDFTGVGLHADRAAVGQQRQPQADHLRRGRPGRGAIGQLSRPGSGIGCAGLAGRHLRRAGGPCFDRATLGQLSGVDPDPSSLAHELADDQRAVLICGEATTPLAAAGLG